MRANIVLCYNRQDTGHAAIRIYNWLRKAHKNIDVFMDVDEIVVGDDYREILESKITSNSILLLLIGKRWISFMQDEMRFVGPTENVTYEIFTAKSVSAKILPVLIDGARMPSSAFLPREIASVAHISAVDVRFESMESDLRRLWELVGIKKQTNETKKRSNSNILAKVNQELLDVSIKFEKRNYKKIIELRNQSNSRLIEAMDYAMWKASRNRLRPFLVIKSSEIFKENTDFAMDIAYSVECLHNASLIQDDLPPLDDDDMRRGMPTLHRAFDEATANLAATALTIASFENILTCTSTRDSQLRTEIARRMASAFGVNGIMGGQMFDLALEGRFGNMKGINSVSGTSEIMRTRMKVGEMIMFCCEAGAIIGGAERKEQEAMKRYGLNVAMAFQRIDDMLDWKEKEEPKGGRNASEIYNEAVEYSERAIECLSAFGQKAGPLRRLVGFNLERRM